MSVTDVDPPTNGASAGARRVAAPSRRRRASASPRYTRFVGMMKLLLPMLALALIVAVIAWPTAFERSTGIPLSFSALKQDEADKLTMLNPRYLGTDRDNQPFVITAEAAEQDPVDQRQVTLTALQADLTARDGSWFTLLAGNGIYHQGHQYLLLEGPIEIFSDAGYEFRTEAAEIDLVGGAAQSLAPVHGQGPFGTLTADRMEAEERGQRLFFRGNVRLVIRPQAVGGQG